MGGFTLFDPTTLGPSSAAAQVLEPTKGAVHRNDPETSRAAADRPDQIRGQKLAVLRVLFEAGENGLTDYEASVAANLSRPHVAGNRRKDLQKIGFVEQTDKRRPTDTGCDAIVWRLTEKGRQTAEEMRAHDSR